MTDLKTLYPPILPYDSGFLDVGDDHRMYFEQSGNPNGAPIVFLHGGPGSGSSPWQRQLFDPDKYRIILFDQRGSGQSTPHAGLDHNTTPHLIADMEALRHNLDIEHWHIAGGSWGSTLALAYADAWPDRVLGLVLYGIFLCRPAELRDLYFDGGTASKIFPDVFEDYLNILPPDQRDDPLSGYRDLFLSADPDLRLKAIDLWTRLEKRLSALVVPAEKLQEEMSDPEFVLAHSLVENHYFRHNGFIEGAKLLESLPPKLKGKSVDLIQGRYDMVCPFKTAWELHRALPDSRLHIIEAAGHTAKEPATTSALIETLDGLI